MRSAVTFFFSFSFYRCTSNHALTTPSSRPRIMPRSSIVNLYPVLDGTRQNRGCSRDPNYRTVVRRVDVDVEKENEMGNVASNREKKETRERAPRSEDESNRCISTARACVSIIAPNLIYGLARDALRGGLFYFFPLGGRTFGPMSKNW